jgi:hypothetical protein
MRFPGGPVRRVPVLFLALFLLLAGCATGGARGRSTPGAPAPAAAVERFLRLAGEKSYAEMGWVFGTAQGPIIRRDPPAEVERRMFALASILEHQSFSLSGEEPVAGRAAGTAVRTSARLTSRGRRFDVPFVVVRGPEGRWFVEEVGVEAITNPR